jgi:hypothetical protein
MKMNTKLQHGFTAALFGLILAGSTSVGLGQATTWMQTFDNSGTSGPWTTWWTGPNSVTFGWSANNCTTNDSGSGSLQIVSTFSGNSGDQFNIFAGFDYGWQWDGSETLDGTQYKDVIFDIMIDPSTALGNDGTFGTLAVGFAKAGWGGTVGVGNYTIPKTATNWTHVVLPIDDTAVGLNAIVAIDFDMWSGGNMPSTWTAYIDNLEVLVNPAPPAPVGMSMTQVAAPGLRMATTVKDGNGTRQNIYCLQPASWVGASSPVTYSLTITNYPGPANPWYQCQMFLCAGQPYGPSDATADWNATNTVFVQIQNTGAGMGELKFMYKVNCPGSSGSWGGIFGTNVLCDLTGTSMVGTYSMTFTDNTNVFISIPGASTNITMPAADAAQFADPMYAYFGIMPNNANNVTNLSATFANVSITNLSESPPIAINDWFATDPLNTAVWSLGAAGDQAGIWVVPADALFYVNWSLPANNYSLYASSAVNLPMANWFPTGLTPIFFNGQGWNIIEQSFISQSVQTGFLTSSNNVFFRGANLPATQLQVLLPGETNAPGTLSGKSGTPSAETLGTPFNLTINACDAAWHIITSCNDTVAITSSDTSAWLPPNTALVNGTVTIVGNFFFQSSGTWTVTATDQPPGTLSPGVSTPITISQ